MKRVSIDLNLITIKLQPAHGFHASSSSSYLLYVNVLLANKSFRRKPESREISYHAWIPAFAGMTEKNQLKISSNPIVNDTAMEVDPVDSFCLPPGSATIPG